MSMNKDRNWQDHFRDWEEAPQREGDWDSPSLGLWDKIAQDLPPSSRRRARRLWLWWSVGLGLLTAVVIIRALIPQAEQVTVQSFPVPVEEIAKHVPITSELYTPRAALAKTASADADRPKAAPSVSSNKEKAWSTTTQTSTHVRKQATDLLLEDKEHRSQKAELTTVAPKVNQVAQAGQADQRVDEQTTINATRHNPAPVSGVASSNDTLSFDAASALPKVSSTEPNSTTSDSSLLAFTLEDLPTDQATTPLQATDAKPTPAVTLLPATGWQALSRPEEYINWPPIEPASAGSNNQSRTSSAAWLVSAYLTSPMEEGLQDTRRNWRIAENQGSGWGLSLLRSNTRGWLAQLGVQYDKADFAADSRYLRILNPAEEVEEGEQRISNYEIDESILKSSATPATVTIERNRSQPLPDNLRIILKVKTSIIEENWRFPLYLGRQVALGSKWGLQLQAGAVINQSRWERRTTSITANAPQLRVRRVRFPERVTRLESWSVQLALGAGVQWQVLTNWQLGLQWQRLGQNQAAPQLLQNSEQQLLLRLGYQW
ncbi:MAG: hypothetical protein D6772_03875 [Bacteroidetes bacterium]|nr:MAG: hypothetical protein D6772_03875 [Bacteroidota bacterium]